MLKDKRILVTGSEGFIGSHLVEKLSTMCSNKIKALVYYNSFNNHGWLDNINDSVKENIEVVMGDVRDSHQMNEVTKEIDIVFHLAALIGIPYSYNAPNSYIETNVNGTLNILQAARTNKIERTIITSTSEVYGTARYAPIDENHPLQAQSPYSASKIAADKLGESFYTSFDLPVITVRPFNTYGPRQSERAIIPTIIKQILNGSKSIFLGNLSPTRDLVFVEDTVLGFIKLAETKDAIGEVVNIATQKEVSMGDLANQIISIMNPNVQIKTDEKRIRSEGSEVERLLGSNIKLVELTKWAPKYDLETGINKTIEWFTQLEPSNNTQDYVI